jgi:DNA (cytosine-5)-methyltransferase 1
VTAYTPILTVAEYFAGIGLVRMGLQSQGWRVLWANDISEKKLQIYRGFFPDDYEHYEVGDVFDLDPVSIPETTLATCSFPCIDLSLAGNMNGLEGNHSSAFWGFIRILEAQGYNAPPLVLLENVPGWLYSNKGHDFRTTIQALNRLGYACDVFTLDALRFTPQSRLRIFVVGARLPLMHRGHEELLNRPPSLLSARLRQNILSNLDLLWFSIPMPAPPLLRRSGLAEIVEQLPVNDQRWWPEDQVKRHLEMMETSHRERVERLSGAAILSYRTFFRRRRKNAQRAEVRPDDIAGCLRTAVGGSGKQFLIEAGCGSIRMRAMTGREYARLQGVPDNYQISANGVSALTGFGDAVCVPVISWIAEHALNPVVEQHVQLVHGNDG